MTWENRHQPWCSFQHQGPCPPEPAGDGTNDPAYERIRFLELAAERAMKRASGEGYAYEQGRRDALFEVRDWMEREAVRAALASPEART